MRFAWSYECPWEGRTGHWLPILALQFSGIWPWACNFSLPQFLHLLNGDSKTISHSIIIKLVCAHAQLPCCIQLFAILCMVALQAPLSMGFSRQEYWSGLPFPFPGNLPNPGIEPAFLMFPALACEFFVTSATWEAAIYFSKYLPQSYKEHLVGYGNLLQGLGLIQGSNLHLLHCRQILYSLTYLGSPNCRVWFFVTPWTAALHASLSFTISRSLLKLMSIQSVMPSNHLILCHPLLLLFSIFPHQGLFQWVRSSPGGQSIRASTSASVLPMNIQDWFSLGWTGWISLLSKGHSSLHQHHSLRASVLWCSAFFMVQLSHLYISTGKTIA